MSEESVDPATPAENENAAPDAEGLAPSSGEFAPATMAENAQVPATLDRGEPRNLELILDVHVPLTVQLGSAEMEIRDVLELGPGSIVALDKLAGEPVDVYVRGRHLAKGEVVVVDDNFGIRITAICNPDERVSSLR